MATFTADRGQDMLATTADVLRTYRDGQAVSSNSSFVDIHIIGLNTPEQMVMHGSFTGFSIGKPTAGSLTAIVVTAERLKGAAPVATYGSLGATVEQFVGYVNSGDAAGLLALLYSGSDSIVGSGSDDILYGFAGNDSLDGRGGADTLDGGPGNDSYLVDDGGDKIVEASGGGTDAVSSGISYTLPANVENLTLAGASAFDGTGNALANAITGNDAANVLDGGADNDTMSGGAGDDIYLVDSADDKVVELSGNGIDSVKSSVSHTLGANVENLALTGTKAINGNGNGLANKLAGNGAANTLDGKAGADTMSGGAGNDTYVVENAGDKVVELSGKGTDLVKSSISHTLAANVENLTLTGTNAINGTGNTAANKVTGNSAANTLKGSGGVDTLDGAGGADKLYGGTGNDVLKGGAGTDGFYFDTPLSASANVDKILGFSRADDTIFLDRDVFKAIASNGVLAAGAFRTGTAAVDADDRIIYDKAAGKIFYDADGSGSGAAILFAQVTAGTILTNADFVGFI